MCCNCGAFRSRGRGSCPSSSRKTSCLSCPTCSTWWANNCVSALWCVFTMVCVWKFVLICRDGVYLNAACLLYCCLLWVIHFYVSTLAVVRTANAPVYVHAYVNMCSPSLWRHSALLVYEMSVIACDVIMHYRCIEWNMIACDVIVHCQCIVVSVTACDGTQGSRATGAQFETRVLYTSTCQTGREFQIRGFLPTSICIVNTYRPRMLSWLYCLWRFYFDGFAWCVAMLVVSYLLFLCCSTLMVFFPSVHV